MKSDAHTGTTPKRTKARLADVARRAGVGIATVDRVLNERGSVSEETARKVIEAARSLALPRTLPLPYRRGLRIEVVLVRRETPFFARLNVAFKRVAATLDRSVIVQRSFVDETRPADVARRLLATHSDALIVYGQEHAAILEAVASLTSGGVPVVALVSDLPTSPRLAYVGIDHYAAGRTAAFFMAAMARRHGSALILTHSFEYRAHAQRVSGFRDGLADYAPNLPLAAILQGHDLQAESERLVLGELQRSAGGIVGIYNTGGANRAVEQAILAAELAERPLFMGHEFTVHTARMLACRMMTLTIDQNPEEQARRAIDLLLHRFGYAGSRADASEVPFTIFCPENLQVVPDEPAEAGGVSSPSLGGSHDVGNASV